MVKIKRKRKPIEKPKKPLAKKMALVGAGGLAALGGIGAGAKIAQPPIARVRVVTPAKEKEEVMPVEKAIPATQTYTVKKGDSLWKISHNFFQKGLAWPVVFNANKEKIKDPNLIFPGQKLDIHNVTITDEMLTKAAQQAATISKAENAALTSKIVSSRPVVSQNVRLNSQISRLTVFDQSLISQSQNQLNETLNPAISQITEAVNAVAESARNANNIAALSLDVAVIMNDAAAKEALEVSVQASTIALENAQAASENINNINSAASHVAQAAEAANAGAAAAAVAANTAKDEIVSLAAAKAADLNAKAAAASAKAAAATTAVSENKSVIDAASEAVREAVEANNTAAATHPLIKNSQVVAEKLEQKINEIKSAGKDASTLEKISANLTEKTSLLEEKYEQPQSRVKIPAARFEQSDIEAIFGPQNTVAATAAKIASNITPSLWYEEAGGGTDSAGSTSVSPAVSMSSVSEGGGGTVIGSTNLGTTGVNVAVGNINVTATMSNDMNTVAQSITVDQQTVNMTTTFNDDGTVNITTIGPNTNQTETVTLSKSEVDTINQMHTDVIVETSIDTLSNLPVSTISLKGLTEDQQMAILSMRDEAVAFQQAQQQAMQQEVDAAIAAATQAAHAASDIEGDASISAPDIPSMGEEGNIGPTADTSAPSSPGDTEGDASVSAPDSVSEGEAGNVGPAADTSDADASADASAADAEGDASVSAPDSASEGEAGNVGPAADTSDADASADASADATDADASDGGDGGNGGGTVICTELHRQGILDNKIYAADIAFGATLSEDVLRGYRIWGKKLAKMMAESQLITMAVSIFALPWTKEMAYRMGSRKKGHFFGKFMNMVGIPICKLIGKIVKWRRMIK